MVRVRRCRAGRVWRAKSGSIEMGDADVAQIGERGADLRRVAQRALCPRSRTTLTWWGWRPGQLPNPIIRELRSPVGLAVERKTLAPRGRAAPATSHGEARGRGERRSTADRRGAALLAVVMKDEQRFRSSPPCSAVLRRAPRLRDAFPGNDADPVPTGVKHGCHGGEGSNGQKNPMLLGCGATDSMRQ